MDENLRCAENALNQYLDDYKAKIEMALEESVQDIEKRYNKSLVLAEFQSELRAITTMVVQLTDKVKLLMS